MNTEERKGLALVTGASTGIGLELAHCAARDGYDLFVVANEPEIETAAADLRQHGTKVTALCCDLSTAEGVEQVVSQVSALEAPIDLFMANAGVGLGQAFLDERLKDAQKVVDTNISGTIAIVHAIGTRMRARGRGRILFTGSIAGFMPGSFQAVYNATKAFVNSFSFALREELRDSGVTVTCLMPGATDTEFFERAGMLDTPVGKAKKDDPAYVAKLGYEAMQEGEGDVVTGWKNKVMTTLANVTPAETLAKQHRKMAEPDDHKD
jgi:short-subunit dehydrogenase